MNDMENDGFSRKWPEIDFRPKYENGFSSGIHGYFEGKLRYNFSDKIRNRYILNEGYFDLYLNDLDIRLGRQIISWGRADTFKPTDQFKIYDYTDFTKQDEEGILALKADFFSPGFELEGVFVPEFTKNYIVYSEKNRWLPLTLPSNIPSNFKIRDEEDASGEPEPDLSSLQYGFRLNHEGRGFDYAVSYSVTYDHTPVYLDGYLKSIDTTANEAVYAVKPEYSRIQTIGFDWATFLSEYGLRGEMAYTLTKDRKGEKKDIDDPYFEMVSGIDHTFERVIGRINIFILAEYVLDREMPVRGDENQVENGLKHFLRQGIIINSEFKKDDTKKLNVKWIYNLEKRDYLLQPEFKFIPPQKNSSRTSKEIYIRADVLSGRIGTFFGTFRKNDKVEAGIKVYF
ncbi:MAG: hypothetical protein PHX78_03435 [bacterium]|nr:hypothetical protein [bacterium]